MKILYSFFLFVFLVSCNSNISVDGKDEDSSDEFHNDISEINEVDNTREDGGDMLSDEDSLSEDGDIFDFELNPDVDNEEMKNDSDAAENDFDFDASDEDNYISPLCGNNEIDDSELCDGNTESCLSLGIGTDGTAICSENCQHWITTDICSRISVCELLPQNSFWNSESEHILQTWDGSNWVPDDTPYQNYLSGVGDCRFICDADNGYIWNGGECFESEECDSGDWDFNNGMASECVDGRWVVRRVTKMWGTDSWEILSSSTSDSFGNVFTTGTTYGDLDGCLPPSVRMGIFLTKWNSRGEKVWTKHLEIAQWNEKMNLVADNLGNVFVSGMTDKSVGGVTGSIFLGKLDNDGNEIWTKQWGDEADIRYRSSSMKADSFGNILLGYYKRGGYSMDPVTLYLTKFNNDGEEQWSKEWTQYNTTTSSIAIDSSDNVIFVNINTAVDKNVIKYDSSGNEIWSMKLTDYPKLVVCDHSDNIIVAGNTEYDEYATPDEKNDVFLTKYSSDGTQIWTEMVATNTEDQVTSVAIDSTDNIFMTGDTLGRIDDNLNLNAGYSDIYLIKWNSEGTKQWSQEWGTSQRDANGSDKPVSIIVDVFDNIFITGYTYGNLDGVVSSGGYDAFYTIFIDSDSIGKMAEIYCYNGDVKTKSGIHYKCIDKSWEVQRITKLVGTSEKDSGGFMAADNSDNIFLAGNTSGVFEGFNNLGSSDIFLSKFDSDQNMLWVRQLGSNGTDEVSSVAVDTEGNAFVTGYTTSNFDGNTSYGQNDIILIKWNNAGEKKWSKHLGTDQTDKATDILIDGENNIYITGLTLGSFDGFTNAGNMDVFLMKLDNDGNETWTKQFGTEESERGISLALDPSGNIFLTSIIPEVSIEGNKMSTIKLDENGTLIWSKAMPDDEDWYSFSSFADNEGNLYISGYFKNYKSVMKWDTDGNIVWSRTLHEYEYLSLSYTNYIGYDGVDSIFMTGSTTESLDGNTNIGGKDIYLMKFNKYGNKYWTKQWGTGRDEYAKSFAISSSGKYFISGVAENGLDDLLKIGKDDIFLSVLFDIDSEIDQTPVDLPTCKYNDPFPCTEPVTGLVFSKRVYLFNWSSAKLYCENSLEGGYDDWRLPNIDELRGVVKSCEGAVTGGACAVGESCLISTCRSEDCACDSSTVYSVFIDEDELWSTSELSDDTEKAWFIDFHIPDINYSAKSELKHVRCVR